MSDPLFSQMMSHFERQAYSLGRKTPAEPAPPPEPPSEIPVTPSTGFSDSFGTVIYPKDIVSHGAKVGAVIQKGEKWEVVWDLLDENCPDRAVLAKILDKKRIKTKVIGKLCGTS